MRELADEEQQIRERIAHQVSIIRDAESVLQRPLPQDAAQLQRELEEAERELRNAEARRQPTHSRRIRLNRPPAASPILFAELFTQWRQGQAEGRYTLLQPMERAARNDLMLVLDSMFCDHPGIARVISNRYRDLLTGVVSAERLPKALKGMSLREALDKSFAGFRRLWPLDNMQSFRSAGFDPKMRREERETMCYPTGQEGNSLEDRKLAVALRDYATGPQNRAAAGGGGHVHAHDPWLEIQLPHTRAWQHMQRTRSPKLVRGPAYIPIFPIPPA